MAEQSYWIHDNTRSHNTMIFPPYPHQRHGAASPATAFDGSNNIKRPRDANEVESATTVTASTSAFPPPLPFTFDILKRITLRGTNDRTFYWRDDKVHVMFDAFPKASVHMLVLPLDTTIDSLEVLADKIDHQVSAATNTAPAANETAGTANNNVSPQHVLLLRHMVAVGTALMAHIQRGSAEPLPMQMGFHSVPSLKHLHMHVMSQDFENGPALKNKKHYLSFSTAFFLPATTVLREIERHSAMIGGAVAGGSVRRVVSQWRAAESIIVAPGDMKCLWCAAPCKTMPALVHHLRSCPRNKCHPVAK